MTDYDDQNIFAKIMRDEIPANKVHEDDSTLAIEDISPQAPVHTLVIPKGKYVSLNDFAEKASDAEIAGLVRAAVKVAEEKGVKESGYRLIANIGPDSHQEVPHLHFHVLGGHALGPLVKRG
jgi:histidine triad (HIT) family protein